MGVERGMESVLFGFFGGRGGGESNEVCGVRTVREGRVGLPNTVSASGEGLWLPKVLMASTVEKDGMMGEGERFCDVFRFATLDRTGGNGSEASSTSGERMTQSLERFDDTRGGGATIVGDMGVSMFRRYSSFGGMMCWPMSLFGVEASPASDDDEDGSE
jgi:hypothetical protein